MVQRIGDDRTVRLRPPQFPEETFWLRGRRAETNPPDPDPPEPPPSDESPNPPTPRKPVATPEQRFSQNDLNNAATNARVEERARLQTRHATALADKDAEIGRLNDRITAYADHIQTMEDDFNVQYTAEVDALPDTVKRFAPSADASMSEKRRFLVSAAETVRELADAAGASNGRPVVRPVGAGPTPIPATNGITPNNDRAVSVEDEMAELRRVRGRRL